jgi:hypothetical protein
VGAPLAPGETSPSGLYAITSTRGTRATLRISLFRDIANEFRDESRAVHACIPITLKEIEP